MRHQFACSCYAWCPNPWAEREKASKTMQLAKKGKFIIADSSQGSRCASNAVVRGQRALSRGGYPNLYGMHKRLVAGLSGLVTCLQSKFIGTNFRRLLFKLRRPRAFQLSLCFLLGAYSLAVSRLPDGGGESHHFRGNRNPGPGHLPTPAAPQHITSMSFHNTY